MGWPREWLGLLAACRYERDFDASGTIGRGPSMYEMEGPRPVSRHRPADFSASFAPLDHLPGPGTLPGAPVDRITGWLGAPRAVTEGSPLCQRAGVSPNRVAPSTSSASG